MISTLAPPDCEVPSSRPAPGPFRRLEGDVEPEAGGARAALAPDEHLIMGKAGSIIFDHEDRLPILCPRKRLDSVARAGLGVSEYVADQSVDQGTEIPGGHRDRKPTTRGMHVDRPALLVGQHLPESCPVSDDRPQVGLLGTRDPQTDAELRQSCGRRPPPADRCH